MSTRLGRRRLVVIAIRMRYIYVRRELFASFLKKFVKLGISLNLVKSFFFNKKRLSAGKGPVEASGAIRLTFLSVY